MSAGNIDQPNLKFVLSNYEVYMAWKTLGVDNEGILTFYMKNFSMICNFPSLEENLPYPGC